MSWWEALILGIIQGLTEFLPISSDGHLELGKILMKLPNEGTLFIIILHAGTACSTLVVFRQQITDLLLGGLKFKWNDSAKFIFNVLISMIPAGLVGVFFKDEVDTLFTGNLALVAAGLLVTAFFLYLAHFLKIRKQADENEGRGVTPSTAFVMGLAQALAILPGVSRSGSTIATATLLNVSRENAAAFSFIMVLPVIFGKLLLDVIDYIKEPHSANDPGATAMVVGFLSAFVVGLFACNAMVRIVKKGGLIGFAIYCTIVGLIAFGFALR